jgi:hypothetical protein
MRVCVLAFALCCSIGPDARAEDRKPPPEPRISSVHPFTGPVGRAYEAVVRGRNVKGARALDIAGEGVKGRVLRVEAEPSIEEEGKNAAATDLVYIEISSDAAAQPGVRRVRLLTPNGVTNELTISMVAKPLVAESKAPDPIRALPLVVAGRISKRGEVDVFWFEADAGQTLTFQAKSGNSSLDPLLSIVERSPSWLDPNHMDRIAFNDEPLFFPGLSTDAQLVHTFRKAGKYCLKVESSNGQGSADAVYELRILEGAAPEIPPHPKLKENGWEERQFTRQLTFERPKELARRGALPDAASGIESYRAVRVGSDEQPAVMRLPGVVEGRISHPAEAHRIKIRIEKAESIAIEVETPGATMPRFNPVVLLFEPGGTEVATNVYTKRNNNGLYMMKMIQPKVALPLHAPGDYEMEIRDITTDRAGDDFRYRVLVRRQVPHVGKIEIAEDQINLRAGATREVNISIEREEGFNGLVAFEVEGTPAGVTVLPAAPKPVDKPPLPNGGKLERYTPIVQNSALVFMTAPDAAPSESAAKIRIVARPVVNGKMGEPVVVKELPLVILAGSST